MTDVTWIVLMFIIVVAWLCMVTALLWLNDKADKKRTKLENEILESLSKEIDTSLSFCSDGLSTVADSVGVLRTRVESNSMAIDNIYKLLLVFWCGVTEDQAMELLDKAKEEAAKIREEVDADDVETFEAKAEEAAERLAKETDKKAKKKKKTEDKQ